MTHSFARGHRQQSPGEEIANSVVHGVGFLGALVALPILIVSALPNGRLAVVGAAIFGGTVALLYLASTLYHALAHERTKHVFQILDHGAIYLLIAGTYTPILLGALRGPWGWSLLGIIWALAIGGVVLKSVGGVRHPRLSTLLYVAMGWLIVVAARPMWTSMPGWGLFWLAAGGAAYTAGVLFYANDRLRYGHFVWHLFVLIGTGCHFIAVWRFSAGR
ncbi:MAG: hemolysin III family protein [Candidatus Eisenbacteria bacterium]|nr:hemolysin III family protein [Candidatus Eisenbacteria bacterium]